MTRAGEKKIITLACFSVILAIVAFGLIGCRTLNELPTETKVTLSYEGAGAILETALPTLKNLCDTGAMSEEDCTKARLIYNEAVDIFKGLEDTAILVVDTGDGSTYSMMAARLIFLLTQIQTYGAH